MTQAQNEKSASSTARRPTIMDIARKANVSGWTVSQVLNGRTTVSIAAGTRSRVLEIAANVGYRPNFAARALVSSRTQLVAIWMCTRVEYSSYYGSIQHGLQKIARLNGYNCIVEGVALDGVERSDFSRLLNWPVDGVIACDVGATIDAYISANPNDRLPIVNVGAWAVESVDSVKLDLVPGSQAAVRHLIEEGCMRIAFMSQLPYDVRAAAYRDAMREGGRQEEYIATPVDTRASACETFRAYVAEHGLPHGLLCENDEVAIGCYRAVAMMGARVPDDIAIVGCDGIEDTEYQAHPISTVKAPIDELCAAAWEFLLNRINDPATQNQRRVITPELVIRQSSHFTVGRDTVLMTRQGEQ